MDMQTIKELQGYAFLSLTIFLVFVLYGYFYHLFKSERSGRRNYEKYSNLALNDELSDAPIERNFRDGRG